MLRYSEHIIDHVVICRLFGYFRCYSSSQIGSLGFMLARIFVTINHLWTFFSVNAIQSNDRNSHTSVFRNPFSTFFQITKESEIQRKQKLKNVREKNAYELVFLEFLSFFSFIWNTNMCEIYQFRIKKILILVFWFWYKICRWTSEISINMEWKILIYPILLYQRI